MHAFDWFGNHFVLSEHRVIFWEEQQTIIASDLHLGKSGHFRKSGIAIPQEIMKQDLMRLFHVLQHFGAKKILVVGDMFHSTANQELQWFAKWRNDLPHIEWVLIQGNHDILQPDWYAAQHIALHDTFTIGNLLFTHEPPALQLPVGTQAVISGHIHPGIHLSGAAKQQMRLPCFYFSQHQCILPAFGVFTGTHLIKPKKQDRIFAIANQTIIPIQ
ncbi:MAG TPA: ligase-associated DNA damage response endonuclease PdeM [Phnomibacter sp.]|nr:ligase-associated DNA damage response endonuclease PdeM [Phnomibacter sp.]